MATESRTMDNEQQATVNPLDYLETQEASSSEGGKEAAALDLDDVRDCPICHIPMQACLAGERVEGDDSKGIPVWVCLRDRVCLPQKDQ